MKRSGKGRRWLRAAVWLIIGATAVCSVAANPVFESEDPFSMWEIFDHFTSTDQINVDLTTAKVNTAEPGTVTLPLRRSEKPIVAAPLAALHTDSMSLVVAAPDAEQKDAGSPTDPPPPARHLFGFAGDGLEMRSFPPWNLPDFGLIRAIAWTGDSGHLIVAQETAAEAYAVDQDGNLHRIATIPIAASSVAGAQGRDFWALVDGEVQYFAWTGLDYREVPSRRISGLTSPICISSDIWRGAVAVLDGTQVRYFASDGGSHREVPSYNATVEGAVAVALLKGGGYRVLVADENTQEANRTVYFTVTDSGVRPVPEMDDNLDEGAFNILGSPWGEQDYVALTASGLRYRAFDSMSMRPNPFLSADGAWWTELVSALMEYVPDAELVSGVWTGKPVGIVLVSFPNLPPQPDGTSFTVQVTANFNHNDPAATVWENVPIGSAVQLQNPGYDFAYRILLHTDDPKVTPVIDEIQVKHLYVRHMHVGDPMTGTKLRVLLVR